MSSSSCLGGVVKGKCQTPLQGPTQSGNTITVQPKAPIYALTGNAGFQAPIDLFSTVPEWEVDGKATYAYGFSEVVANATQLTFKVGFVGVCVCVCVLGLHSSLLCLFQSFCWLMAPNDALLFPPLGCNKINNHHSLT
jgi:hypothetical protein